MNVAHANARPKFIYCQMIAMYARVYTGKQNQLHPLHPVSSSRRLFLHIGQLVVNLSVEERPLVAYQRRL